jgi:hypothetical protein
VHAELLLVDLFYWKQFDFLDDDAYIGCSKPACYNCFQYILAHPENFALPACHNKLYLTWRTPDILEDNVSPTTGSRIREGITNKMNSNTRAELRRQIDSRCARKPPQYDSVTGTSSSIQGGALQQFRDLSQDGTDSVVRMYHSFTKVREIPVTPPDVICRFTESPCGWSSFFHWRDRNQPRSR